MTPAHKPLVYIISAPSGSGKSTLVNELLQRVPGLDFSISFTTRAPRGSEKNGKQYCFIPREAFEQMIRADEFLEHANVYGDANTLGDYYGTARKFLREAELSGHDLLLDIDVQGAAQIKQKLPDAVSIFILPPDRKTLEWRLRNRSEDPEDVIERRLTAARREIENYNKYDYILINDNLKDSVESLVSIVKSQRLPRVARSLPNGSMSADENKILALAERCQLGNVRDRIQPILASFVPSVPSVPSASK
jgi:guanylate kinase